MLDGGRSTQHVGKSLRPDVAVDKKDFGLPKLEFVQVSSRQFLKDLHVGHCTDQVSVLVDHSREGGSSLARLDTESICRDPYLTQRVPDQCALVVVTNAANESCLVAEAEASDALSGVSSAAAFMEVDLSDVRIARTLEQSLALADDVDGCPTNDRNCATSRQLSRLFDLASRAQLAQI